MTFSIKTRGQAVKRVAFVSALTLLSACTSLIPIPEPSAANTVYRFSASTQDVSVVPNSDAIILRVDRPTVPRPLAGRNVIVSPSGNRILTASGAEWAEKVPDLIQGSIMDVFASRAGIVGVLPVSGARTELRIHLNVRNFEAVYDQGEEAAPLAVVRYTATLANASNRNLIGSYDVRKTERARDNRVSEIVRAQDRANAAAINAITDWVLDTDLKTPS